MMECPQIRLHCRTPCETTERNNVVIVPHVHPRIITCLDFVPDKSKCSLKHAKKILGADRMIWVRRNTITITSHLRYVGWVNNIFLLYNDTELRILTSNGQAIWWKVVCRDGGIQCGVACSHSGEFPLIRTNGDDKLVSFVVHHVKCGCLCYKPWKQYALEYVREFNTSMYTDGRVVVVRKPDGIHCIGCNEIFKTFNEWSGHIHMHGMFDVLSLKRVMSFGNGTFSLIDIPKRELEVTIIGSDGVYSMDKYYKFILTAMRRQCLVDWQYIARRGVDFFREKLFTDGQHVIIVCTTNHPPIRQESLLEWCRHSGLRLNELNIKCCGCNGVFASFHVYNKHYKTGAHSHILKTEAGSYYHIKYRSTTKDYIVNAPTSIGYN